MPKNSPARILVIEPLIRCSLAGRLSDSGYDVVKTSDGARALRVLSMNVGRGFDAVVVDDRVSASGRLFSRIRALTPKSALIVTAA